MISIEISFMDIDSHWVRSRGITNTEDEILNNQIASFSKGLIFSEYLRLEVWIIITISRTQNINEENRFK